MSARVEIECQSRLTAFRSGGISLSWGRPGSPRCGLTSALIDGASGRWLGEIRAAEDESLTPFTVLMTCARMVADEIGRRVRVRAAG